MSRREESLRRGLSDIYSDSVLNLMATTTSQMPIQRDAWPHASMEGSSVSQAAPPQNVAPRQVCNKRDGEDLAPEEAKKTKSQAKEARHGGKTSVTAMWGNTQIQNPVFKQRMEDERLAAGMLTRLCYHCLRTHTLE